MSGSSYENFQTVYQISYDPTTGAITKLDSNPGSGAAVAPTSGSLTAGSTFTEDYINPYGAPSTPEPYDPTFTYIGVATMGGNTIGIIGENADGQYFLFAESDTVITSHNITHVGVDTSGSYNLTGASESPNGVCYMAGTAIATPDGDVAVETIKIGDVVSLSDGRAAPVTWLGIQTISTKFADKLRVLPIRIKANALGDGVPARDLLISPDHAILLGDILVQAGALVNGVSILRETGVPETFTYYHVEVADHSLILAENVPAETFVDNVDRMAFDNWAEHQALYGDAPGIAEMAYPRAKAQRQVPQAVRNVLLARAQALYGKELATAA